MSIEKNPLGSSRWTVLCIVLLAAFPLALIFLNNLSFTEISQEFITYRVGNALSLMFGEWQGVLPIQGIPTALLSRLIVEILFRIFREDLATSGVLQVYCLIFFLTIFLGMGTIVAKCWPGLSSHERWVVALFVVAPWYFGGPSIALLASPEYWFGEYAFLSCSIALLPVLGRAELNKRNLFLVGAWLAIGASIKITLIGIAPIFFLSLARHSWREMVQVATAFSFVFVVVVFLYAGFSFEISKSILANQIDFFRHPNELRQFADLPGYLLSQSFLICLMLSVAIGVASRAKSSPALFFVITIWVAIYMYLAWRRPSNTSLASAALSGIFIALFCSLQKRKLTILVVLIFLAGAVSNRFENIRTWYSWATAPGHSTANRVEAKLETLGTEGMFYIPTNYWNAGLPVQTFGYNGQLGTYTVTSDSTGRPEYVTGGRAFHALYPRAVITMNDDPSWTTVKAGLMAGVPLHWTRREEMSPSATALGSLHNLESVLEETHATVVVQRIFVHGEWWLFGTAKADNAATRNP